MTRFNGIVSDMYLGTGDITADDFNTMLGFGAPVGYDQFRNLIAGDYEYSKAIFKAVQDTRGGSYPRLLTLNLSVDVPDVFDRGTATTSATAVVTVPYNRPFYGIGEVICTEKGGAVVAVPRVSNITLTNFGVELIDTSGNRVAGTISWSAKGY